jgi:hypothetical protein
MRTFPNRLVLNEIKYIALNSKRRTGHELPTEDIRNIYKFLRKPEIRDNFKDLRVDDRMLLESVSR